MPIKVQKETDKRKNYLKMIITPYFVRCDQLTKSEQHRTVPFHPAW